MALTNRTVAVTLLSLLMFTSTCPPLWAQNQKERLNDIEYQIKASYIYNFLQFINFPPDELEIENILSVCILGENRFGSALNELQGATIPQGSIDIDYLGKYSPALSFKGCNVLYIIKSEAPNVNDILRNIEPDHILTISEYTPFIEDGGIIELFIKDDSIHFKINSEKAKQAHYQIAAQLVEVGMEK